MNNSILSDPVVTAELVTSNKGPDQKKYGSSPMGEGCSSAEASSAVGAASVRSSRLVCGAAGDPAIRVLGAAGDPATSS